MFFSERNVAQLTRPLLQQLKLLRHVARQLPDFVCASWRVGSSHESASPGEANRHGEGEDFQTDAGGGDDGGWLMFGAFAGVAW